MRNVKCTGNVKTRLSATLVILLLVVIVTSVIYISCGVIHRIRINSLASKQVLGTDVNNLTTVSKDKITINIVATGDVMCHSPNFQAAYNSSTKSYDFSSFFTNISHYVKNADIAIGNLETTFSGAARGYSGYPMFNTPEQLGIDLAEMGIDVLTTANNHSLDRNYSGIESTLNFLDSYGLSHTGTARSVDEQNNIIVKDVSGIKVAFLTYTYGTNGIPVPSGKPYCVNLIDKNLIKSHIAIAKEKGAELICVSMHWGVEYQTYENSDQQQLAAFLFENGVDVIFGSHPHVLEPMEKREITLADGTKKNVFVIYSLGNFVSNQYFPNTQSTVLLDVQVSKDENGVVKLDKVDYIPMYMYRVQSVTYKLIDIRKAIAAYENGSDTSIGSSLYSTIKSELAKIEKTVGKPIDF